MKNPGGETDIIGRYDENKLRMIPSAEDLCSFGVSALRTLSKAEGEWVYIDEIGYLEKDCEEYCSELLSLMEKKRLAAVVRKQDIPFLRSLCSRDDVFLVDLDNPFGNLGCVIMASGMGKRFGGNKLMADFCGKPMICRILEATEGIFEERTVVTRHKDIAELCERYRVKAILHDRPYRSDTVRIGLEAVGDVKGCMFCPADQPLLSRDTVVSLALAAANGMENIWRASYKGSHGMPVVFPGWAFKELGSLSERKGGSEVIKNHPEYLRTVEVRDEYELRDIDTPEDMAELSESQKQHTV